MRVASVSASEHCVVSGTSPVLSTPELVLSEVLLTAIDRSQMNSFKYGIPLSALACAAACMALLAPEATAQPSGPRTASVTFSAPVQLPGIVLPAGVYVFERILNVSDHGSVNVWSRMSKAFVVRLRIVATKRASAGNSVTFRQIQSGAPPAIAAWYINGGVEGYEFLYSADELRRMSVPAAPVATLVP